MNMSAVIILAGGKSRRMGRDKLALETDGQTMLQSVVSRFQKEFEQVYISVADADKYPDITARRIVDIYPGAGPMSGLHAALSSVPDAGVFLVAADLPYAEPGCAKRIIDLCGDKDACMIRHPDMRLEPLFGYYRKTLLKRCEAALESGNFSMGELILGADVKFVDPGELFGLWDEKMLMNVNYPEDYENFQKQARRP